MTPRHGLRRYLDQFRKHDRRLWSLVALQFIMVAGFSASMAFFALYLHVEREVPMERVGFLIMVASVASAPVQALAGAWSDRFGRRPFIAPPLAIRGVLFLAMSALVAAGAPYLALVLGLLLARVLGGVFLSAADAMLADITPPADRVEAYSLVRTGGNLGWAAGPAIGGLAAEHSYPLLFALTAVTSLVAAAIGHWGLNETRRPGSDAAIDPRRLFEPWRHPDFAILSAATLLLFVVMGQMIAPLSVYSTEWRGLTKAQFGYLCSTNGLLVVLLQHPISLLLRRFRASAALVAAAGCYTVAWLVVARASTLAVFMTAIAIMTLGEMLFVPTSVGLVSRTAPAEQRGQFLGTFGLVRVVGWASAPWLGGVLLDRFAGRPLAVWGSVSALAVLAGIIYAIGAPLYGASIAGNRPAPRARGPEVELPGRLPETTEPAHAGGPGD